MYHSVLLFVCLLKFFVAHFCPSVFLSFTVFIMDHVVWNKRIDWLIDLLWGSFWYSVYFIFVACLSFDCRLFNWSSLSSSLLSWCWCLRQQLPYGCHVFHFCLSWASLPASAALCSSSRRGTSEGLKWTDAFRVRQGCSLVVGRCDQRLSIIGYSRYIWCIKSRYTVYNNNKSEL